MNPGPIPFWLILAVVALFTVGQAFPSIDTACAETALAVAVGTFTVLVIRSPG